MEDLGIIQRIKDSHLEIPGLVCVKKPDSYTHQTQYDSNIDLVPVLPRFNIASPNICSTDFPPVDIPEDSFIFEAINDDEFHHSSGECISQTFVELGNSEHVLKEELTAVDPTTDDLVYSQNRLVSGPHSREHESSFVNWKKGGLLNVRKTRSLKSQKLLKRMLFEVPKMHRVESRKDNPEINKQFQTLNSILPSINKVRVEP